MHVSKNFKLVFFCWGARHPTAFHEHSISLGQTAELRDLISLFLLEFTLPWGFLIMGFVSARPSPQPPIGEHVDGVSHDSKSYPLSLGARLLRGPFGGRCSRIGLSSAIGPALDPGRTNMSMMLYTCMYVRVDFKFSSSHITYTGDRTKC